LRVSRERSAIIDIAEAIGPEDLDLGGQTSPDGAVTILFTDIEGSTAMLDRLGDERFMDSLRRHNAIVRAQVAAYGGTEVKSQGDGFMLAFSSAYAALRCSIALQRAFEDYSRDHSSEPLRVRIGLHSGFVIAEAGDFFGRTVNLAARIADRARGGEILVSEELKEYTERVTDARFLEGQEVTLAGLSGRHRVFPVAWDRG
jgi:class 3 adenylate cyclase